MNENRTIIAYIRHIPIYRKHIPQLPYNPYLYGRAKALRKQGIVSEIIFWKQVHKRNFYRIDFDRQKIIGNYIVDFYIKRLGLVIEIDGTSHIGKEEYDAKRELFLLSLGLKVYRISAFSMEHDLENVMRRLEEYIVEEFG